jgi:hypothetical protein
MKKIIATFGVVAFVALLSSCDDKLCYCYERISPSRVNESNIYVKPDTPCSGLSTEHRGCVESYERDSFDPNSVAK